MSNKGIGFIVFGAIAECGWAYGLKHANSYTEYGITIFLIFCSFYSFMQAFKYLPVSIAYTLFVGLGAFFIIIVEMITDYIYNSEVNLARLFFMITLILGVLGLKKVKN